MNGIPMVSPADAQRFADQVVDAANGLAAWYVKMGREVPPPTRLFLEAQCAWTVQLLHHIMGGTQVVPEPGIIVPRQ